MINWENIDSENFEFLIEDILKCKGFNIPQRPARGPDQGKDIIAERQTTDNMMIVTNEKYIVECKHFYTSGKSVRESDLGNFLLKIMQHKANRYLIATSSVLSETVKNQLTALSDSPSHNIKCTFWVKSDLESFLLNEPEILKKYFGPLGSLSQSEKIEVVANYLKEHHFQEHRGAILICPG